jgi:hypothetical protein
MAAASAWTSAIFSAGRSPIGSPAMRLGPLSVLREADLAAVVFFEALLLRPGAALEDLGMVGWTVKVARRNCQRSR